MKLFNNNFFLASLLCLFSLNAFSQSIFGIIENSEVHTTLEAAVVAAGLDGTLSSDGPFTVFAPTDEAFAKLPKGTVEMLLKPENKAKLAAVLTYHVVSGKVTASDVMKIDSAETVQGQKVMVKVEGGNVMINGAKVIMADVKASNGVIHVIDKVLLPPSK